MELFLAACQGLGLASAVGVRALLPTIAAGTLARTGAGLNFADTEFEVLQSWPFLAAVLIAAVVSWTVRPSSANERQKPIGAGAVLTSVVLGALLAGASLADIGYSAWPGLAAGAAAALVTRLAVSAFLHGARRRLDRESPPWTLSLYAEVAALALAALSVLIPPVSLLALAASIWVLVSSRRRGSKKYAGLRVLR